MDAIEKIVEQILEKGQIEIAELKQSETKRIDQAFQEQAEALALQEKKLIEKNTEQATKAFKQKQNRQQLEIKQATLNKKQGYLEELFCEAVARMNQWPVNEFQSFAAKMITQLSVEGDVFIKLGDYSKGKLSEQWLSEHSTDKVAFHLKADTIANEGGFIVVKDGIEYNFLFSSLVQEIKKVESFQLAEKLFN